MTWRLLPGRRRPGPPRRNPARAHTRPAAAWVTLCALGVVLLGGTAAQAEEVLLRFGDTVVPKGTIVYGDALVAGGTLDVAGTVTGRVVVAGGSVHVSGRVGGDVRAVGGDVVLASTAVVGGSAQASGGHVTIAPGAVVRGAAPSPPAPPPLPLPFPAPLPSPSPFPGPPAWMPPAILGWFAVWKLVAGLVLVLLLAAFVATTWFTAALVPGATAAVAGALERNPGGAGLAGVAVWLLAGPVMLLLALTVAGLLLVLLVISALLIAAQVGIGAVAVFVGRRVRPGRIAVEALIGAVLLALAFAVPHAGWLLGFAATIWGTGGVAMAIVERRGIQGPIPPAPSAPTSSPPSSPVPSPYQGPSARRLL